jgi:ribose transport system ATP-binding protein
MTQALISMVGMSKAYGGNAALDAVSLDLMPGEVHGLMGENGAGKSTLMKILAGVVQADAGTVYKRGVALRLRDPRQALEQGISTVFQELSLLPNLSIAENMFLGKEPMRALRGPDTQSMQTRTADALAELGMDIHPSTLVFRLTVAQQQFVEIARGISAQADVVILDEPTAALNAADVHILQRHIRSLKAQGKAIVYISHRMEEIFQVCDRVTVLKDGRHVGTRAIAELTPQSLIAMMVGREISDLFPPRRSQPVGEPLLRIQGLRLTAKTQPVDVLLCRGELVALAGLEGQGQREMARSLFGVHRAEEGVAEVQTVRVEMPASAEQGVRRMQSLRVGFVPEDRKDEGLFQALSIQHNLAIGLQAAQAGYALADEFRDRVDTVVKRMAIKVNGTAAPVGSLSGGNQQKVLLGRYLLLGADVLVIEEPTRGVDVGAKAEIYKLLREFAERGGAALVLSRETIELIGLCDRIYVVHGGRVVRELAAESATEHQILDAALSSQR